MLQAIYLLCSAQTNVHYADPITWEYPFVATPSKPFEATMVSANPSGETFSIRLPSVDTLENVKGYYKIFIDLPNRPGGFDSCLVFSNNISFPMNGVELLSGKAALIDTYSHQKLEDVVYTKSADSLILNFKAVSLGQAGTKAILLGAHFLPLNFDLSPYRYGMGTYRTEFIWASIPQNGLMLPPTWKYLPSTVQEPDLQGVDSPDFFFPAFWNRQVAVAMDSLTIS